MNRENQVARTEEHAENQRSDQEVVAFGYFFHNVISLIIQIRYFEILAKMSFFEVKKIPPDKNLKGRLSVLPPLFQQAIADLNSPRAAFFDKCNTLTL
ncbi:ATP-dependent serine protease [Ligilactobacillus ruminis]|uniref:ATP-dependent serine protease n=1 Tax=Ligilactobacillus ruminis TaxID=1623 RepID=A0A837IRK7_9LACO|nr:ATP-dependent serine protease [Ligilactobacillus ruminis]